MGKLVHGKRDLRKWKDTYYNKCSKRLCTIVELSFEEPLGSSSFSTNWSVRKKIAFLSLGRLESKIVSQSTEAAVLIWMGQDARECCGRHWVQQLADRTPTQRIAVRCRSHRPGSPTGSPCLGIRNTIWLLRDNEWFSLLPSVFMSLD